MYARLDWTFDNETFYDLPAIVQDLHDHDQHYINIIDVTLILIFLLHVLNV